MKILLVNDDGYEAEGIQRLYEALTAAGHEVMIVAPMEERSGVGHSVTLRQTVRARRRERGFAIGGTPADCVKIGIRHLMPECELVVSGINPGANLGVDVNYSGTASAAREAAIQGRKALAVSCFCRQMRDAAYLCEFAVRVAEITAQTALPAGTYVNLNLPNLERGEQVELAAAPLGWFIYNSEFEKRATADPGEWEFVPCYTGEQTRQEGEYDMNLIHARKASVSLLSWDSTALENAAIAGKIAQRMKECRK